MHLNALVEDLTYPFQGEECNSLYVAYSHA